MAERGVTPALATLLLVITVVAAAVATYVWVSSYLGSIGRGAGAPQFRELLKVESVRAENGAAVVTVRNIGKAKVALRAVYVMKGSVAVASDTSLNIVLEPGQTADLSIDVRIPPGEYLIKIVTATGVEAIAPLPLSGVAQQPEATLTISVEPPGGGTTDPPPGEHKVAAGNPLTVRAIPNQGYAFAKWLLNGSDYSTSQEVTVTVRGPTSLTAVFAALQPKFAIVSWTRELAGPAGSTQSFAATVENMGGSAGTAELVVSDHTGAVVGSAQLTLQPGERGTVEVPLTLPSEPGTYTWLLKAFNTATGNVDASESFTVTAWSAIELVRNGDFSEDGNYWELEDPWQVDPQGYARVKVETNGDFVASVSQDLEIPEGTASLTLSFRYYLAASRPGQVNRLELKAYLIAGGSIVWESEPIQWDGSQQPVWKQFTQTFQPNVAERATLKITLTADVKEVGAASSIDARLDDVSLVAAAPP